ncbi:hypothetical protein LCGC14_0758310 [marine sediment metagenome]|uniref:Uncharacterized protein n=1 Tax=marine sediment metagenome TaxID=412755 RepID=A0A0F9Q615_9ZZZZ
MSTSKLIRVDQETFNSIEGIRRKGESKGHVIERLLYIYWTLKDAEPCLSPDATFQEFQERQEEVKV